MQKLETINTKQIVTESVETKQVITESVATPARSSADPVFKGSIARSLAEEFGYVLDEAPNDPNATAATAANTKAMQAARTAKDGTTNYTSGLDTKPAAAPAPNAAAVAGVTPKPQIPAAGVANPYQGADAAKFAAMSPADQAWLTKGGGKPDINDQFILARAPNKGAPAKATGAVLDPTGPASGKESDMMAAADQADADLGAAMTANAAQADAIKSGAQDDATGVDAAVAANAADDAKRAANPWPADKNAIIAFQKANGLTADGLIGPKTMAALQKSGATPPAGFKPAGAAPAKAPAATAAPQAAQKPGVDVSGRANAAADPRIAGNAPSQLAAAPKPTYNAAKDSQAANTAAPAAPTVAYNAAKDSQAANTAPAAPASSTRLAGKKGGTTGNVEESIVTQDDAILAMIRNIRVG